MSKRRRRAPARSRGDALALACVDCSDLGIAWPASVRRAGSAAARAGAAVARGAVRAEQKATHALAPAGRLIARAAHKANAPLAPLERKISNKAAATWHKLPEPAKVGVIVGGWVSVLGLFGWLSGRINASTVLNFEQSAADAASALAQKGYQVGQQVFGAVEKAALAAIAPAGAQPYIDALLDVAQRNGISPFVMLGLVAQESAWGAALRPKNDPGGTGDFEARLFKPSRHQALVDSGRLKVVADRDSLPGGWTAPNADGPYIIPADELGFGRGFVQFDYVSGPAAVRDPAFLGSVVMQLQAAADLLKSGQQSLIALLNRAGVAIPQDDDLLAATISVYNHGPALVAKNIENGDPIDTYSHAGETANNNYSGLVLSRAAKFGSAFAAQLAAA